MARPNLRVVDGEEPVTGWQLRHWVGVVLVAGGIAFGVWTFVDPTLGGQRDGIMSTLLLFLVATAVIHHRIRNPRPPEREPDQVVKVIHVHRRWF